MTLRAKLEGTVPGWGVITVIGDLPPDTPVTLAVRSNQTDAFLHPDSTWERTPHWFTPSATTDRPNALLLQVGNAIVDGINSAPGRTVSLVLRLADQEYPLGLTLPRWLAGSQIGSDELPPPLNPGRIEPIPTQVQAPKPRAARRFAAAASAAALFALTAGVVHGWHTGWLPALVHDLSDRFSASGTTAARVEQDLRPVSTPIPTPVPAPIPAPLESRPADRWARAEAQERDGDCKAAADLYTQVAAENPGYLYDLAARYDPATRPRPPCEPTPNPLRAENLYHDAVKQGVQRARYRLGEILTAPGRSRPDVAYGMRLLREAAEAGDQGAAQLLDRRRKGD